MLRKAISLVVVAIVSLVAVSRLAAQSSWPTADSYASADKDASSWILPARSYAGNRYLSTTD
ncbi:MAG TPA: hypothetical protein VIH73_03575, partial [Acidimicrobiales bacterium]